MKSISAIALYFYLLALSTPDGNLTATAIKLGRRREGITIGGGTSSRRGKTSSTRQLGSLGSSRSRDDGEIRVNVAVVLPHSMFKERLYKKEIRTASDALSEMAFNSAGFKLSPFLEMVTPIPAPTEILEKICYRFLKENTAVILYLTDSEDYGQVTVASQYFMTLAQYLRLPVVAWNADNSAQEQGGAHFQLQLAPTLKHQAKAIMSIMDRYGWHTFSIVTGTIAGHRNFDQVFRELISHTPEGVDKKKIVESVTVEDPIKDLGPLVRTEARVFLLYSTEKEAQEIFKVATDLGLTGRNYVWIATQAVIGPVLTAPDEFPVGMLGIHFKTDKEGIINQISPAMSVVGEALNMLAKSKDFTTEEKRAMVQSNISCESLGDVRWEHGETLFNEFIRNVVAKDPRGGTASSSSSGANGLPLTFQSDGSRKYVELLVVNLQASAEHGGKHWEEIGTWYISDNGESTNETSNGDEGTLNEGNTGQIDIKDIVWPGGAMKPPDGIPEKRFVRVTFLEEDPYVMLNPPTTCTSNKGIICQMKDNDYIVNNNINVTEEKARTNSSIYRCCTGFCIDLLNKFASDLHFEFQLVRVKDGKWGGEVNGKWNGLVAELINHETDLVMTSLKINSGREKVIDFSVPFLETGITILVAKRTGIISPTAFLEPFDTSSWLLVSLVAIQVAAGSIFFFEWLSPAGYDMKTSHTQSRFSFARTLWLAWAVLFQAAVNVDCPRGYTSRFMAHVWATFALIFLAIYTANLAAFMITREEYHNLSGVEDSKLSNPTSVKPPFRFGTIPNGATDYVLKNNFPDYHSYMGQFNRSTVKEGFKAVKGDKLDAFIYDATVLEYLVGQDDECNILTVGSWYAMTGYGVAFPKGSPWVPRFNEHLMHYRENGDLERMQRFWFTGACEPRKRRRTSSKPLALAQFMSAFLLLGIGTSLSVLLLLCEHAYFKYLRELLTGLGKQRWCAMLSLSFAQSLKKRPLLSSSVVVSALTRSRSSESQHYHHHHCTSNGDVCRDLVCRANLHVLTQELYRSRARIEQLRSMLPPPGVSEDETEDQEGGFEEGSPPNSNNLHFVVAEQKSSYAKTVRISSFEDTAQISDNETIPDYDEVETVL